MWYSTVTEKGAMTTSKKHRRVRKHDTPSTRGFRFLTAALFIFSLVFASNRASAGPVTNPTGAPYAKVSVYQGVVGIVNKDVGNTYQALELGNHGTDIASSSDIYIRPDGMARDANTNALFSVINSKTNLSVPGDVTPGRLCLGGDCQASWPPYGLDDILANGSTSLKGMSVGALIANGITTPSASLGTATATSLAATKANIGPGVVGQNATLVVGNGVTGTGSGGDAIAAFSNNATDTAVYGQNNFGYAGYFSGNVHITGTTTLDSTLSVSAEPIHQSCFMSTADLTALSTAPAVDVIAASSSAPLSQNWSTKAKFYKGTTATNLTLSLPSCVATGSTSVAANCATTSWRLSPASCTYVDASKASCAGIGGCPGQDCVDTATFKTTYPPLSIEYCRS